MADALKCAVVERERRFLVARLPDGVHGTKEISDRYVIGTRMRLREVREIDGTVVRELGHKVRVGEGPAEVACTNFYVNADEWTVLLTLPALTVHKKRHMIQRDGWTLAVDEHGDGTLVAEIDDGDQPSSDVPGWLDVLEDVSEDERWTGAALAR